jgi:fructokinase
VTFDKREPCYCFQDDVAWDHLRYDENWQRLATTCAAVSFGTLAQRSPESREAIVRFLRDARQAMRLFDVNLRQSFYSTEVIWQSLELATAAKCNVEELHILGRSLDLEGPKTAESDGLAFEIMARFDLDWIAVTRGRLGTSLYAERGRFEANVPEYPAVEGADSVGAGDASGAGLMIGSLLGWPNIRRVAFANELGSYVSSRRGAIPPLPEWLLARVAADTSSSAGNVLATK